ncbi:MAG: 50S ribosomal protein L19 [Deltaproteobacteria bacterium]|nr:MAG: 50S ribosomal protein L19 [Deltaproteobacteria bacterium]
MNTTDSIEKDQLRKDPSRFSIGDTVKVYMKIKEGEKERVQVFEGTVIRKKKGGSRASFTVRKVSYSVGVERIFPLHSPLIEKIEVVRQGKVRRSRLYYLRQLRGKGARIKRKGMVMAYGTEVEETATPEADTEEEGSPDPEAEQSQVQESDT